MRLLDPGSSGSPPLDYGDTWRTDGLGSGGYLRPGLDLMVRDGYGGTVSFVTESHGFRRREDVAPEPPPGSVRLLVLGDSFVAGYRVDQEATFTHLLTRDERPGGPGLDVLAATIEHPVTGLDYLDRHGLGFHPDAVLVGVTLGNDIVQTWANLEPEGAHRWASPNDDAPGPPLIPNPEARPEEIGQRARRLELPGRCFDPRRAQPPNERSWLEALAARSQLARRLGDLLDARSRATGPQPAISTWNEYRRPKLLDSNGLGVCLVDPPEEIEIAFRRLETVLGAYRDLARAHDVDLVVALFPQRYAVQPEDWQATVEAYGLLPECFDPTLPNRRLATICRRLELLCLDPTDSLRQAHLRLRRSLYLPGGDMHWNALGHRTFTEAIRPLLLRSVIDGASTPAVAAEPDPQHDSDPQQP